MRRPANEFTGAIYIKRASDRRRVKREFGGVEEKGIAKGKFIFLAFLILDAILLLQLSL